MLDKFLKFLFINKVEETYFINFTIVTISFVIIYVGEIAQFVLNLSRDDQLHLLPGIAFFLLAFVAISFRLVKQKNHNWLLSEFREVTSFIPLLGLSIINIIALMIALKQSKLTAEHILLSYFLLRHLIVLLLIVYYSFCEKYSLTRNKLYASIRERFKNALGSYQTRASEVIILIVISLVSVYLFRYSTWNIYSQYLFTFAIIEGLAYVMKSFLHKPIIKNQIV